MSAFGAVAYNTGVLKVSGGFQGLWRLDCRFSAPTTRFCRQDCSKHDTVFRVLVLIQQISMVISIHDDGRSLCTQWRLDGHNWISLGWTATFSRSGPVVTFSTFYNLVCLGIFFGRKRARQDGGGQDEV